jgi:hypothetical protein
MVFSSLCTKQVAKVFKILKGQGGSEVPCMISNSTSFLSGNLLEIHMGDYLKITSTI